MPSINVARIARAVIDAGPDADWKKIVLDLGGYDMNYEQTTRFFDIVKDELKRRVEEAQREADEAEADVAICKSVPEANTFKEACIIAAKRGDQRAQRHLDRMNSLGRRRWHALFDAAVEAHPDWVSPKPGHYRKVAGEPLREDNEQLHRLVEWFQRTHPKEAREIERRIEEESA